MNIQGHTGDISLRARDASCACRQASAQRMGGRIAGAARWTLYTRLGTPIASADERSGATRDLPLARMPPLSYVARLPQPLIGLEHCLPELGPALHDEPDPFFGRLPRLCGGIQVKYAKVNHLFAFIA
jgi:hypothetical protein